MRKVSKTDPLQRFRTQNYAIVIHLAAIVAAVIIIGLNLGSYFIGKELQGRINTDGTKMLALQLTAKLHELLMLASLSNVLWTLLLEIVTLASGAPFASLTVGDHFADISYLWSTEFWITAASKFQRKTLFMLSATLCTILGVIVGPSSATAMAPSFEEWPASQLMVPLNVSEKNLWPLVLDSQNIPDTTCTDLWRDCNAERTWISLKTNLFSYWGQTTLGGWQGMPEIVSVPGSQAVRTMRVRFRGPFNLYQPVYTATTVQPVWAANTVNGLRGMWFTDSAKKCEKNRGRYCSYKDIVWTLDILQPNVLTSCNSIVNNETTAFPTMSNEGQPLVSIATESFVPIASNTSYSRLQWLNLDDKAFSQTSVGVIVEMPKDETTGTADSFACTILADWANSSVSTAFLGSPFVVDGLPGYFDIRDNEGSTYSGLRVRIQPEWAQTLNPVIATNSNQTAFDLLYSSGQIPANSEDTKPKVEAILSVLVAEGMSWVGARASVSPGYSSNNLTSINWEILSSLKSLPDAYQLPFRTTVFGYGYGLRTASGFVVGKFLSILTLVTYCVIVISYLIVRYSRKSKEIDMGDNTLDMVGAALRHSTGLMTSGANNESGQSNFSRKNVRIVMHDGHAEMELVNPVKFRDHDEGIPLARDYTRN